MGRADRPTNRDLLLASGAAAAAWLFLLAHGSLEPLRLLLGLPLVLVLPGYALVAAFAPSSLVRGERALLSLGLSLAVGAVAGIVLDRLPWGLDTRTWSTLFALITLGGCALAARRRDSAGPVELDVPAPALAAVRSHVSTPFYRAGYTLMLNQAVSGALGVVYWLVAVRLYSAHQVGENAALITTMILVAVVTQLSLKQALTRFVPRAGARTRSLLSSTYLVVIAAAALGGIVFAVVARSLEHGRLSVPLAGWLVVSVISWSLFDMEDGALTGMRRSDLVLVENTVYNLAKILLLVALSGVSPAFGVLLSWTLPLPLIVLAVNGLIFGRLARRHEATFESQGTLPSPRTIARSVGADYAGTMLAELGTRLLPLLVIAKLGGAANAYFYQAWLIATMFSLLALGLAGSFTVEAAADPAQLPALSRRMLVQLGRLLVPAAAVAFLAAPWILRVFGANYAREGTPLLRWLLAGTVPMLLTTWYVSYVRVTNRYRAMIAVPGIAAALTLGLAVLLLPRYGIEGAGIAWFVAQLLVAAGIAVKAVPLLAPRSAPVAAAAGPELYLRYLDAGDDLVAIGRRITAELMGGRPARLLEQHSEAFDRLRRLAAELEATGGHEVRAAAAAAQRAATRLFVAQADLGPARAERLAGSVRAHAAASTAFADAARRELGTAPRLAPSSRNPRRLSPDVRACRAHDAGRGKGEAR